MVHICYLRAVLGIETVFCSMLQRMTRTRRGLKLEKTGPTLLRFNGRRVQKSPKKLLWVVIRVRICLITLQEHFVFRY